MPADYRAAAERHWEDAGFLLGDSRLPNADHLLGLSAECALKAIMLALGMQLHSSGAPASPRHRVHADGLWNEFMTFSQGRGGARYAGLVDSPNPFADWKADQRYEHRKAFAEATVESHRKGAESAMRAMQAAIMDGLNV